MNLVGQSGEVFLVDLSPPDAPPRRRRGRVYVRTRRRLGPEGLLLGHAKMFNGYLEDVPADLRPEVEREVEALLGERSCG